ncbi:MAG TPA: hypothetical protein VFP61_00230, partial [Acidimicrobiales bacterium]|nr:hypothetical protein [Acidimicrobiales bacterium]
PGGAPGAAEGPGAAGEAPLTDEEQEFLAEMAERQRQLAEAPGALVVAQNAFLLVELAAVKMGAEPPSLDDARLAIDALGAMVEAVGSRLGEVEPELRRWVTDLRVRYVEAAKAATAP